MGIDDTAQLWFAYLSFGQELGEQEDRIIDEEKGKIDQKDTVTDGLWACKELRFMLHPSAWTNITALLCSPGIQSVKYLYKRNDFFSPVKLILSIMSNSCPFLSFVKLRYYLLKSPLDLSLRRS